MACRRSPTTYHAQLIVPSINKRISAEGTINNPPGATTTAGGFGRVWEKYHLLLDSIRFFLNGFVSVLE